MYSVYQHWDPLKVCIVGKSYSPEFYSFITDVRVRSALERIATETEEDYQKLISLLRSFNVQVMRPQVNTDYREYVTDNKIILPPMTPRDYSAMIGNRFFFNIKDISNPSIFYKSILDSLQSIRENKVIFAEDINAARITRIGKDLYFGNEVSTHNADNYSEMFPDYRCHIVLEDGHTDGSFCPVTPGLIISLFGSSTYKDTFPGWEVIELPGEGWNSLLRFQMLKTKHRHKWWVLGQDLSGEFANYIETWLNQWSVIVKEKVFDTNMLVIDDKNVVCNNYNKKVFDAFDKFGITAHIINFRHRYFWDGGLHCITSDLHRQGTMKDYFPDRQ